MLLRIFCTNLSFFNTASGMDCMQWAEGGISARYDKFQYRKRYGLHAMLRGMGRLWTSMAGFNTVNGMDCMQ